MPAFHLRDGLLHLDDMCLFRRPTEESQGDVVLRALGRLAAESMDAWRTPDGLAAHPRTPLLAMTLLDAVCVLRPIVASLEIVDVSATVTPGVTQTAERLTVVVPGRFDPHTTLCAATPPVDGPRAGMHQPVRPVDVTEAYTIVVTFDPTHYRPPLAPLCAPTCRYRTVAARADLALRVHVSPPGPRGRGVALYRCGLLWAVDDAVDGARAVVDVHTTCSPMLSGLDDAEADALAGELLCTKRLAILGSPALAPLVEEMASIWASFFRPLWRFDTPQEMVSLVRHASTPPAVVRLVDMDLLLAQCVTHERTNVAGLSILRRMQTDGCTRDADWLSTSVGEFAVVRFQVVPIPPTRFAQLVRLGCFDYRDEPSCEYGLLTGEHGSRTVVVPIGCTTADLTHAVATLLKCEVATYEDTRKEVLCMPMSDGTLFTEGTVRCDPDEALTLYRLRIDVQSRTLMLSVDTEHAVAPTGGRTVLSVDALETLSMPTQAVQQSRPDLVALLPQLTQRLSVSTCSDVRAIVREVQCRRLAQEWTMEGLDAGKNLSSLGLSLLLAMLLTGWCGCRTRVAMGRTRAAMLAVWTADETFVRVDPTRTLCNLFEASDYLMRVPTPATTVDVSVGKLVEIRYGTKWLSGVVRGLDRPRGQFTVELLHDRSRHVCGLRSHTWRRVTDDACDLDRHVGALVEWKRKRTRDDEAREAQRPCARA